MKKILFAMAVLFGCFTVSFAQNNYVATLQHEGQFTHHYGSGALTSAYNAATEGDIITLSPGTFSSPVTIDKGITLRGTGIDAAETDRSIVSGNTITFRCTDSTRVVKVEGVLFHNTVCVQNNVDSENNGQGKITFIKNYFGSELRMNYGDKVPVDKGPETRFYNCYINSTFNVCADSQPDYFVYNSYVKEPYSNFGQSTSAFVNCIIAYTWYSKAQSASNMNFYNCIFDNQAGNNHQKFPNTVTCYNCVCYGRNTLFDNILYGGNYKYVNADVLYNYEEGHAWYELTPEAQETYLGTDGTQVGLYGGNYPYNSKVQYPVITSFISDVQTSKEGILNINVEVDGQ